jgi:hypothetical protein
MHISSDMAEATVNSRRNTPAYYHGASDGFGTMGLGHVAD